MSPALSGTREPPALDPALRKIALRHRSVMLAWIALVLQLAALLFCLTSAFIPSNTKADIAPVLLLAWSAATLTAFILTLRLRVALGDSWPVAILLSLPSLFPILNLGTIPAIACEARPWLRQRFGRVPFLGVTNEMLVHADASLCSSCGYDLNGMRGRICPECGASMKSHILD